MRRALWIATLCVGCAGGLNRGPVQPDCDPYPLEARDFDKPWIGLYVPHVFELAHVIRTPRGFFALSRATPEGRAHGSTSYLDRSTDGTRWQFVPLPRSPGPAFDVRGIAYGNGRWVIVGTSIPESTIWTSRDGTSWSARTVAARGGLSGVVFAGQRFFALSNDTSLLSSSDGERWQSLTIETIQARDVAFGNGRYLLVGSGPLQLSEDGLDWESVKLGCDLPGACIADPSGALHQHFHENVVFHDDRFYVDRLFSHDGSSWQAHSSPSAELCQNGWLLARVYPDGVVRPQENGRRERVTAWKPDTRPRTIDIQAASATVTLTPDNPPPVIENPLARGESCRSHRCVVIKNELYLIP